MRRSDPFTRPAKAEKRIPFDFVLDALADRDPVTRPMFGCTAVYVGERIVFILRDKGDEDSDRGVWLSFTPENQAEVLALYPALEKIDVFGDKVAGWRKLPARAESFEDDVLDACKRVRAGDLRFGKVPGAKKAAKKKAAKKAPTKKNAPAKKAQRPK